MFENTCKFCFSRFKLFSLEFCMQMGGVKIFPVVGCSADLSAAPGEGSRVGWRLTTTFLQWLQHQSPRTEACRRGELSPKDPTPAHLLSPRCS